MRARGKEPLAAARGLELCTDRRGGVAKGSADV